MIFNFLTDILEAVSRSTVLLLRSIYLYIRRMSTPEKKLWTDKAQQQPRWQPATPATAQLAILDHITSQYFVNINCSWQKSWKVKLPAKSHALWLAPTKSFAWWATQTVPKISWRCTSQQSIRGNIDQLKYAFTKDKTQKTMRSWLKWYCLIKGKNPVNWILWHR